MIELRLLIVVVGTPRLIASLTSFSLALTYPARSSRSSSFTSLDDKPDPNSDLVYLLTMALGLTSPPDWREMSSIKRRADFSPGTEKSVTT